jgi:hypothetical protein
MSANTKWILSVSFLLAAVGFLLPLWPLSVLGIALAALSGRWIFAIAVGVLLDLAYGAPVGTIHYLYFPFTLSAVVLSLIRYFGAGYVFNKDAQETL